MLSAIMLLVSFLFSVAFLAPSDLLLSLIILSSTLPVDRLEPKIQQPTGDGSGNSRRRGGGGRDGGRGGGCSGDSLCGGSGSGDGDINVAATTAMTAMCGKRG